MILTVNMPDAMEYEIRDGAGRPISSVYAYDTQTAEVEMILYDSKGVVLFRDGKEVNPIVVKTFIPGSYAIDKRTGKKIA